MRLFSEGSSSWNSYSDDSIFAFKSLYIEVYFSFGMVYGLLSGNLIHIIDGCWRKSRCGKNFKIFLTCLNKYVITKI